MTHPNSHAASARLAVGGQLINGAGLYRTPTVAMTDPGQVSIILGTTISGLPVTIATTSTEWLDALESAIQVARTRLLLQTNELRAVPS